MGLSWLRTRHSVELAVPRVKGKASGVSAFLICLEEDLCHACVGTEQADSGAVPCSGGAPGSEGSRQFPLRHFPSGKQRGCGPLSCFC